MPRGSPIFNSGGERRLCAKVPAFEGGKERKAWGDLFTLPAKPKTPAEWKKRLSLYLEDQKTRLLQSKDFQYARDAKKSQRKYDNDSLAWDRIKGDCMQALKTLLPH